MILLIIIIALASNIVVSQIDPLNYLKEKLGLGPVRKIRSWNKYIDIFIYSIWKLLNCPGCVAYWTTVLYYYLMLDSLGGFYIGVLSYGLAHWLYNNLFVTKIN